jgi:ribosome-associated protein
MDITLLHQSIIRNAVPQFSRSGGPGGQNVNKVNTKAQLRLALKAVEGLSEAELARARERLSGRVTTQDEIVINSTEERSQRTNLRLAYERLEALITEAARLPKRRRPTRPSRGAREKRLEAKRRRAQVKAQRSFRIC